MKALTSLLVLLTGCASFTYPKDVYKEAAVMCKPFGGMSNARISVKGLKYTIRSECLEGHVVNRTIESDE